MLRHARGQFFVRLHGKAHYLGTDEATARVRYERLIEICWNPYHAKASGLRVRELAQQLYDHYDQTRRTTVGGGAPSRYWRQHLRRFVLMLGEYQVVELAVTDQRRGSFLPPVVQLTAAVMRDLQEQGLSPKTIRHDLIAIRRLFAFAASHGLCPKVDFDSITGPRQERTVPKVMSQAAIQKLIDRVHAVAPVLTPWLALNYLACLRPSEVVSLVHAWHGSDLASGRYASVFDPRTGRKVDDVVFELDQHKTSHKTLSPRLIVLTPPAVSCLEHAEPRWSQLNGYCQAIRRNGLNTGWPGPKALQKSAASHLRAAGVRAEDVQKALGHALPGVYESYAAAPLLALAQTMRDVLVLKLPW